MLLVRSRILRNTLAIISLAGIMFACNGSGIKDNTVKDDSLKKVKEQQQKDSLIEAKSDSIRQATSDSIVKTREDSAKSTNKQSSVKPTFVPPNIPGPGYGVVYYQLPKSQNDEFASI